MLLPSKKLTSSSKKKKLVNAIVKSARVRIVVNALVSLAIAKAVKVIRKQKRSKIQFYKYKDEI